MTSALHARPNANQNKAIEAAYRMFLRGERVDMQGVAAALGVDRTTLFRWVGSRDALLTAVITRLGIRTLDRARAQCTVTGPRRVAEIMGAFARSVIEAPFFRAYLEREGPRALRLLTTNAGGFQMNLTHAVEELLEADYDRSLLAEPIAVHDLAFLMVRIVESFVYTDLITGEEPNAANARAALLILLS
ncbi:QsdR family transcriptional regulator [Dactylosporangium sp. CA-092794]|uniref:QsdR family transcriptional regulator n=1 Tax=Dactylosporangium sp. CA-092794 TaxID=3239929 RepID=UPI003D927A44